MRHLILALLPITALANGVTNPPPVNTPPVQSPTQTQSQAVTAPATASPTTTSAATASPTVTASPVVTANPTATGGAGGNATAGSATSSSGGNAQTTTFTSPRQAPGLAQGSLFISGCAAGGTGGGSGSGGAAFLGISWVPADCKLLLAAGAYQALGMNAAACEMVNSMATVRRQWKRLGVDAPACK